MSGISRGFCDIHYASPHAPPPTAIRGPKSHMPNHEFIPANVACHRDELIQLNVEYLSWVFNGIEELFGVPADQVVGMPASVSGGLKARPNGF